MTWPTATLTAGNYTSLRSSSWQGAGYACLCPNTVVWSTTLSTTASGDTNAVVAYGSTISGNASDVQIGHRILIGTVNDIRQATFSGRVRTAPAGGLLGINETSASLTNGMYLWVVDDYPLLDKLSRPVGDPPVQYKDFDLIYEGLKPVVAGIQLAYAGFINSSNKLRIAFNASNSFAAESGATISSYLFTFTTATYTVISGSLSTAIVTVDFNEGFQWGKLVVTDSGGRTQTRHFMIFACGNSTTPALSFQGATISGNLDQGWSASSEAFADVSSVLNNTPIVFWTQEYYGGTEGPINNNIDMVGWLQTESDPAQSDPNYSLILSSQFEISGIGTKLARLESQLLALSNVTSPTLWDEINNLTPWRGIVHFLQRHTTLLELVDLTFGATAAETDNTFLFPYLTTQGGNVLASVNGIANQINASMEFAPDGAVRIVRDARYLTSSQRNALITYADWTSTDYSSISEQYTHEQGLGKVDADGAYYDGTSGNTTAFRSRAPGLAQDSGPDTVNLNNQILAASVDTVTAQAELNQRAGDQYEISSSPSYILSVAQPDNYHFLLPSRQLWYTWTLTAGTDNIRGISYTTSNRWLLESLSVTINNDAGTRSVQVNYRLETPIGNAGTTINIPVAGSIDTAIPAFPPFDPFPNFPDLGILDNLSADQLPPFANTGMTGIPGHHIIAPRDGNTVLLWTASQVWTSRSFKARSSPVWTEITPENVTTIRDCKFTPTGQGSYVLADISGGGGGTNTYDFTTSAYSWISNPGADVPAVWTPGTGWMSGSQSSPARVENDIRLTMSPTTITSVRVVYSANHTADTGERAVRYNNSHTVYGSLDTGAGSFDTTITNTVSGITILDIGVDVQGTSAASTTISLVVVTTQTGQVIFYTPDAFTNPVQWTQGNGIGAGTYTNLRTTSTSGDILIYNPGGADVRLSSDNGLSFGSAVSVGTTPGSVGGFDVNKIGNTSIATQDQKTRSATTLGGSYSDTSGGGTTGAEPLTIYIPRYKWGGLITNANLSAPDFALGASALVGGEAFWKVSGGVQTAMTPSHSGTAGLAFSPDGICMTYLNGKIVAYLAKVIGTAYLFTTSSGTAWTDRGSLAGALSVRIRKSDLTATPALFIAGGSVLKYSPNLGATLQDRTKPIASGLLGIEVLG